MEEQDQTREAVMEDVMAWMRHEGIVLRSAKGPIPNVADHVAGEAVKGSWWGHPAGHQIYAALEDIEASGDVVTVRLIAGKLTLVHRRLWPALVRLADRFSPKQLASVIQEHTPSGAHRNIEVAFPEWVPPAEMLAAQELPVEAALLQLPAALR